MREAAVMLIINKEGLILAISRREDPEKFGLIGGKVEDNETAINAAIRETLEETGVKVYDCELIYTRVEPKHTNDGHDFNTHCFVAKSWDDSKLFQSSEEGIVKWLTIAELTSPITGAFPHYNAETIAAFKNKFPTFKVV